MANFFDDYDSQQPTVEGNFFDQYLTEDETQPKGRDATGFDNPISTGLGRVLKGTGGAVMRALEVLDRPRSAVVSGIKAKQDDKPVSKAVVSALKGEVHPSFAEVLPDMETTVPAGMNVMGASWEADRLNKGQQETGDKKVNLKNRVGFIGDLFLDPVNLLAVGVLSKAGTSGKLLKNIVLHHGDDIGRAIGSSSVDDMVRALQAKNPAVVDMLKAKGVKPSMIEAASKAGDTLAPTLAEQAEKGQWAALRLKVPGLSPEITTPKAVNRAAAKGLTKGKVALANSKVGLFMTESGDEVWDSQKKSLRRDDIGRRNQIAEDALNLREELGWGSQPDWIHGLEKDTATDPVTAGVKDTIKSEQDELVNAGLLDKPINEPGYSYFPHVVAQANSDEKVASLFTGRKRVTTHTPHTLPREIVWLDDPVTGNRIIGHADDIAKANGVSVSSLNPKQATVKEINDYFTGAGNAKLFEDDPVMAVTVARLRNNRAINGSRTLDWALKEAQAEFAKTGGAAPKGWVTVDLSAPKRYVQTSSGGLAPILDRFAQLEQIPMPKQKARILQGMLTQSFNPGEAMKGVKDLYKGTTSLWKRYTLFPFSEYHFRNMVGDYWNMWMQGMNPAEAARDSANSLILLRGKSPKMNLGALGNVDGATVLKAARDKGVIGTGQYGEILSDMARSGTSKKGGVLDAAKRQLYDLEWATKKAEALESHRRLSFFLNRLKKGDNFDEAADAVMKTLYDYGDLSEVERGIRDYLVPFYSWYRKNIPAQFRNLLQKPGKVAVLPKTKAYVEGDSNVPEEQRPEWMASEFPIHLGPGRGGVEDFAMLGNWIPTVDIFEAPTADDLVRGVVGSTNPYLKIPLELLSNKDTFTGKPVDVLRDSEAGVKGMLAGNERTDFLGKNIPTTVEKLSELLPFSRILQTLDRMNPGGIFDEGEGYEPARVREGEIKTRPYHTEMTTKQKVIKNITGLKAYPVDVERSIIFNLLEMRRAGKAPGLNEENLKRLIKRAVMEGDKASAEIYMKLLESLASEMGNEAQALSDYQSTRQ